MRTRSIAAVAGVFVLGSFLPHAAANVAAFSPSPAPSAWLPTGQTVTPLAAPGAMRQLLRTGLRADGSADAGGAMATAVDPAGDTLLVLTSGYNYQYSDPSGRKIRFPVRNPITGAPSRVGSDLTQWIFVYHIRGGNLAFIQHISVPDTFNGLAWAPDGRRFYVSGGIDDRVLVFGRHGTAFAYDAPASGPQPSRCRSAAGLRRRNPRAHESGSTGKGSRSRI